MFKSSIHIVKPTVYGFTMLLGIMFLESLNVGAEEHPSVSLTQQGVQKIKEQLGRLPIFDQTLESVMQEVDLEISRGIDVPVPKDLAGGYTHERHKMNYQMMQKAGSIFQITGNERYAVYVRDMLMTYADLFPTLDLHPATRSYARGKLFWQCLNDANWLVYTSQAYDCIHDFLNQSQREKLENSLFRPYADFLSTGNPRFFNRIHNHSTWGNAAVGMIGLVMNDDELIERALYGLKSDDIDVTEKDDDGGFIKMPGQTKSGFLANLEHPFSPDGYYTEGPYYQRYAMYPFMVFAQGLQNVKPELGIFAYKDSVLIKAVGALLNLTDQNGRFFPLNDAQKGMSYLSRELVSAVDIAYHFGGNNPELLSIANKQERVLLNDSGLSVAEALATGKEKPFVKTSIELKDGPDGNQGGIGILRSGSPDDELCLVMKYTAHGFSHGHFDKLSFSLYDNGSEIVQDYGFARFVNIEQKNGGGYLKENTTWAKQTIAHNTLVVDETSHFKGEYRIGSKHHSDPYIFSVDDGFQIASAKEVNAYPGIEMHRTMALIEDDFLQKPIVLDILRVHAEEEHQYDLPYYFKGQLLSTDFQYDAPASLKVLGNSDGYQHLWSEATGISKSDNINITWLTAGRFYSITAVTDIGDQLLFNRLGANDPKFNLRRDGGIIIRKQGVKDATFAAVIEPHGHYGPVSEIASSAFGGISKVNLLKSDQKYSAVELEHQSGQRWWVLLANENNSEDLSHKLSIDQEVIEWQGPYKVFKKP